jgi:uncharacterized membrane protein
MIPGRSSRNTAEIINSIALLIGLCSILVFILWQLGGAMKSQKVLNNISQSQSSLVLQSEEIQSNAQKMLNDLIELSETNENAKAVIQKYGISKNQ